MQILKMLALFMLCFSVSLAVSCKSNCTDSNNDNDNPVNPENNKLIANKVRILYTANLDGCILSGDYKIGNNKDMLYRPGFARISTVLNNLRSERISTLTVSGGNDYGREFYDEFNGVAAAILLDEMGYDIITPELNEFKDGEDTYDASIKDTKYDILSGNMEYKSRETSKNDKNYIELDLYGRKGYHSRSLKRRVKPFVIKEINGHKIGFLSSLGLRDLRGLRKSDVDASPRNEFTHKKTETEIILTERTRQIREEGAEIIIFLVGSKDKDDVSVIKQDLLDVDIALLSLNEKIPENYDKSKFNFDFSKLKTKVYFYSTYETENTTILQIDLEFVEGKDGKNVIKQSHKMVKITKDTAEDPKIKKIVDEFASQLP